MNDLAWILVAAAALSYFFTATETGAHVVEWVYDTTGFFL